MKIHTSAKVSAPHRHEKGAVLIITMLITGIIGFCLASYLTLVSVQNRSTMRSQTWNASIPVVEAGIEEALSHLNVNGETNISADGWQSAGGRIYRMRRQMGESYYVVDIDVTTTNNPVVHSEGFVPAPLASSQASAFIAQVGATPASSAYLSRKVRVTAVRDFVFVKGMVAKGQIDMNGNNIATDSFDSSNPSYSTSGQYDPAKRKDKGDVATNSGLVNSLNVGNADILGHVSTGPGGTVAVGANGLIGDARFMTDATYRGQHDADRNGIQDGWSSDDMNVNFADVKIPFTGGYYTPSGGSITQRVVNVTLSTNNSASYPSGSNIGVVTNTTSTTTASRPGSGTYIGSVTTNYGSVTTPSYPSTPTFRSPITTNTTVTTTSAYPASHVGKVTTNTTSTTSDAPPPAGTYVGSVTTKFQNGKTIYTFNKITSYTYNTVSGFTYSDVVSYTYNAISGYGAIVQNYSTNTTVTVYDYILKDGDYQLSSLSGKTYVAGNARLYVTGNVSMSGQDKIDIAPNNSSLSLYVGGASASLGGQGVVNEGGKAENFYYYGLPTNTSLSLSGNAGFTGVIYAPSASLTLNGGGNNYTDFSGASVTKTVTMNGHFKFHYDESLARAGLARGYIVTSWGEE